MEINLVRGFRKADLARFLRDSFSVRDDGVGFLDWDAGVVFLQILEADFQVQLSGTSDNVLSRLLRVNLDHRIGFGQSFKT